MEDWDEVEEARKALANAIKKRKELDKQVVNENINKILGKAYRILDNIMLEQTTLNFIHVVGTTSYFGQLGVSVEQIIVRKRSLTVLHPSAKSVRDILHKRKEEISVMEFENLKADAFSSISKLHSKYK